MKNIYYIILFAYPFLFFGCESEELLSPDTVNVEYTVVQSEINPGKLFPGVRFTKTLPLGIPFDIEQAEIKNITAYILKNEVQVVPLHYKEDGWYKPLYDFYVEEGDTYELLAIRNGKYIYAKTSVPFIPSVASTNYSTGGYYFDAIVNSNANEVYGALWIVPGIPPAQATDFYSITSPPSITNEQIFVRTSSIPEEYRKPNYSDNRYIQVFSFDYSFRKYFYSRTSGQQVSDPFIQGGGAVEWNVQGDKTIGMFIGIAVGEIIKVN
jgi:hypothetical protein